MKTFNDIEFIVHPVHNEGVIGRIFFDNGYGVSVVKSPGSYGYGDGKYEVAVLDHTGEILYDTPITKDVIGYLTENGVSDIMEQVQNLDKK
jgi:hypothetical protein